MSDKKNFRRLLSYFGLYMNKEATLSETGKDFYITTGIERYWTISGADGTFVAIVECLAWLDLSDFFEKVKFGKLYFCPKRRERNELVYLLNKNLMRIDRITVLEDGLQAMAGEEWIRLIHKRERCRGAKGVRERMEIVLEGLYRSGVHSIELTAFLDTYKVAFWFDGMGEISERLMRNALSLQRIAIPPLYLDGSKSLDIKKIMKSRQVTTLRSRKQNGHEKKKI